MTAIGIDAVGSGVWMPVSMIFFLATTDLSLVQVGLALSLASLLSLPVAVLVGQQVDRHGSKKVLQTGNALQAVSFLAYPFVDQVWSVAFVVAVSVIGRTAFWGSYSPMVTLISPPGERELWFGFLGALRNAGFAIGGIVAGVALTLDATSLYYAVALLNAASYVLSFVLLAGVIVDESAERAQHGDPRDVVGGWATVLRDRGYRWLIASNLGYALTSAALNVAIPVYVVEMLGLPGWVSAAVFVINTLMIGVGQGVVVQRMTGAVRARIVALGAVLTAASFLVLWGAEPLGVVAATSVVLVAAVVYTLGELVAGPVLTTLAAESPPPALRGRYVATYQLSWNVATGVAPLLYAWLLDQGSGAAWLGLTGIALLGGLATVRCGAGSRTPVAWSPTVRRSPPVEPAQQRIEGGGQGTGQGPREGRRQVLVVLVDDDASHGRVAEQPVAEEAVHVDHARQLRVGRGHPEQETPRHDRRPRDRARVVGLGRHGDALGSRLRGVAGRRLEDGRRDPGPVERLQRRGDGRRGLGQCRTARVGPARHERRRVRVVAEDHSTQVVHGEQVRLHLGRPDGARVVGRLTGDGRDAQPQAARPGRRTIRWVGRRSTGSGSSRSVRRTSSRRRRWSWSGRRVPTTRTTVARPEP